MIHIIYQMYPYGTQEAFAEDELIIFAEKEEKIKIYNFSVDQSSHRRIPDNCEIVNLYNKQKIFIVTIKALVALFTIQTFKELRFMLYRGYRLTIKNVKRIYNYYFKLFMLKANMDKVLLYENDILYSYWLGDTGFAASSLKNDKIKLISRAHGFDMYSSRGYQPFRREILSKLDGLYCINNSGAEDITNNFGEFIKASMIHVHHLGIKCILSSPKTPVIDDELYICSCSNVIPLKRLDILIDALAQLTIKVNWVHFGDGMCFDEIINQANLKLNLNNIVFKFMGRLPHNKVLEYYKNNRVDIFVNCSDYEGIPVAIMEAMSFGIPAIARNVGGMSELINDSNGIILSKDANYKDYSVALANFQKLDRNKRIILSQNAFNMIRKNYNAELNYNQFYTDIFTI